MKKFYFLLIALCFGICATAQIQLNNWTHTPTIGTSVAYFMNPTTTINLNNNGPDQVWDMSTEAGILGDLSVMEPSEGEDFTFFPFSSYILSDEASETYITATTSGMSIIGQFIPSSGRVSYIDPRLFLSFPMNYGDVQTDTFSATVENFSSSQFFDRTGTVEITADAYGDLILPYGTVNNLLRIRLVHVQTDEFLGVPVGTLVDTTYLWYSEFNNLQIANSSRAYFGDILSLSVNGYMAEDDLVGLEEISINQPSISFYPNPAQDFIFIDPEMKAVKIFDTAGNEVLSAAIPIGLGRMDISSLIPGVYLVKYAEDSYGKAEKLVVR